MRQLAIIALFSLAAACARPATVAPLAVDEVEAIEANVEALLRNWGAAGAEGRWEDLKALYADDPSFYWVEQGRIAYSDYASIVAGVDQAAATAAVITNSFDDIVVTPLGADAAIFRAHVTFAVATADFSFDFDGAFTGVAVRRDGRWKFLNGHLSKVEPTSPSTGD